MGIIRQDPTAEPSMIRYVKNRIKNNKNFLATITGPTGSGKSLTGITFCKMLDPTFDASRIIFSLKELMDLINSGTLKPGYAILWDEAGIDISNKNWLSATNKAIGYLMQTFRHQRLILIMTAPYSDFIDASTRKLFHCDITTMGIDYKKETCKVRPSLIQYNPRNRKFYYKYLRVKTERGIAPLKNWNVPKPPQDLLDQYEIKKVTFTQRLNKEIEEDIATIEKSRKKTLTEQQEKVLRLVGEGYTPEQIANDLDITIRVVYDHISRCKRKGYDKDYFKNSGKNEQNDKK